ncbi:DivIVA domain-containing protein [Chlorogloeopsis sp. ULAP01]|uniref:DivIVA domain-containing protein n=1 Tax=Chlorogloeopsis sp. ULAP01 TaxID=3056483 RepID=UPI0025AA3C7D|nr:DivIVA domain-containing protein [Chlorogloeopsis sp. ULAP01]MDM9384766.1 DivIVA domain-containing protein [Chlorogloeopsis sp. ULAP01]
MLRPKPAHIESDHNGSIPAPPEFRDGISEDSTRTGSIDIHQELNHLEEIILASLHIPLTQYTLVDEEKLLEQLDFVRLSLPPAFQQAAEILIHKEEIILQAEEYGQQIVEAAQAKRAQILDNSEILKQAEREASELRRQVQQECEAMMQETLEDIDRKRRQCQQEIEEMRRTAIAEAQAIQDGADEYADSVLQNIEEQLHDMLRIVRNGRHQLQQELPTQRNS